MGGRHAKIRRRSAQSLSTDELTTVRQALQAHADRGVFRGFSEKPSRRGKLSFQFAWLAQTPYELTYEPISGVFTFTNILPNVQHHSPMANAVRSFVKNRASDQLPEHRRVNPHKAKSSVFIRNGNMRLQLTAESGFHSYGINKIINLAHEVFVYLQIYFPDYLWREYDKPED